MPALHYRHLEKRSDSGTVFSIIFAVILAIFIVAGVMWLRAVREYRRQHDPEAHPELDPDPDPNAPGSVRQNSRTSQVYFPSHPAVRPSQSRPPIARPLPTYNPRTESPFPEDHDHAFTAFCRERELEARPASQMTPSISSNGLFTPVRVNESLIDEARKKYHTVPRAGDAKEVEARSVDFGDSKDFILAVPEPLVLRPRGAGRPPPVVRHLDQVKEYKANLRSPIAASDKHPHPNKLLRSVQRGDVRNSVCSSTSLRLDDTQSDPRAVMSTGDVMNIVDKAIEEGSKNMIYSSDNDSKEDLGTNLNLPRSSPNDNSNVLHRFRSYQSLTAGEVEESAPISNFSRPRIPPNGLRDLYLKGQQNTNTPQIHVSQPKALPSVFSPMSPAVYHGDTAASSTDVGTDTLFPGLLLPKRSFGPNSIRHSAISNESNSESNSSWQDSNDGIPLRKVRGDQETQGSNSQGFYHAGRRLTKPPPLNFRPKATKMPTSDDDQPHRSITDISKSVLGPLIKPNSPRSKLRASSMYSRDTQGVSLVNTPVTPDFPTPVSDTFTDRNAAASPFKSKESVKSRISEWTQRIEGNSSSLPRPRQISPMTTNSTTRLIGESGKDENPNESKVNIPGALKNSQRDAGGQKDEEGDKDRYKGTAWI